MKLCIFGVLTLSLLALPSSVIAQGVVRGSIHYYDSPYTQMGIGAFPSLDLDQNGSVDLRFETQGFGAFRESWVNPLAGRIALRPDSSLAPLSIGDEINSSPIVAMGLSWGGPADYSVGTWNPDTGVRTGVITEAQPLYLAFQFTSSGNTYNGWLSVNDDAILGEIAYNTIPNASIAVGQVPEPGAVTFMLIGGLLFFGWRATQKKPAEKMVEQVGPQAVTRTFPS